MKLLPIFIFFTTLCLGQNSFEKQIQRDSVNYYLEEAKGSLRSTYLKRAMVISREIKNDSLLKVSSISFGLNSYFNDDTLGLKESNKHLGYIYEKRKDSYSLAKIYHFKALIDKIQFQLDSSYKYYHESKNISILLKDSLEVGRRLLSMGLMQKNEKDLIGAENSLIESLKYLEPLKHYGFIASTFNNLGLVSIELNENVEARNYFSKSFEYYSKSTDSVAKKRGFLDFYNNMGYSLIREEKFREAKNYLEKGLEIDKVKEEFRFRYESLYGNLADCLFELGERDNAIRMAQNLKEFREKNKNKYGLSLSHNGLAYYYSVMKEKSLAYFHAKMSYDLAKEVNNNSTMLSALMKLGNISSGGESKKHYQEYAKVNDSLNKKERYFKKQFARVRYETDETEKENVGLKLENTKKDAQIQRDKQQKVISWLVSIAALLALVLSYSFFRNRRKKLMYEAQLEKASAREEERQQIAKSLHDEVAGDLRLLHQKLVRTQQDEEAKSIEVIKDNVRNLSHQLSSESFDEVSFKDQIINLISDSFSPKFRISTEGIDTVLWETINNTIKRTLYLCIRESLQNTIKYAEATKFFIRFSSEKKEILLLLEDNGKGFEEGKGKKGIGLKNLKERVEEIHGSFHIESSEQGTKTTISIPINGR